MKLIRIAVILIVTAHTLFAQKKTNEYTVVDKKALALPDSLTKTTDDIARYVSANFDTEKDRSRAIFIWVATNIQYDVSNMFAINFYEEKAEKIAKPLRTRKGICENYASLFTDICLKAGLKSFVIEGYTQQNGFADYIPHAWSATRIDSAWFLFDPTWGSGYISGGKFYKKINNQYFKASPSALIKSHIPFDYLWQFLNYPVTNQEFYEGKTQPDNTKQFFNFNDSIRVYENQSPIDRLTSSVYRIEKNGIKNSMIFDRLQHLKLEIENDRQSRMVNSYNAAGALYNDAINDFNNFINYRNKQFKPLKPDAEIQGMIDAAYDKLEEAKSTVGQISKPDANILNMIQQLTRAIDEATLRINEQQNWLKEYFSKGKTGRKAMFYGR